MNKKTIFALLVAGIIIAPALALAADAAKPLQYSPPYISGVPGFDAAATGPVTDQIRIQDYLVRIYQFAIGISGITAVGMIIWGAINMSLYVERVDRYEDGKTTIIQALVGLALLFGSYLLLQTINPEITQLKEPGSGLGVKLEELIKDKPSATTASSPEACGGGNLAVIPPNPSLGTTNPASTGCEYKRLILTKGIDINSNAIYSFSMPLPAGTMVWMWPYFETQFKGRQDAQRCVIYAYRLPPTQKTSCSGQEGNPMGEATTCTPDPAGEVIVHNPEMMRLNIKDLVKCSNDPKTQGAGAPLDSGVASSSASGAEAELLKHGVTVVSSGNCRDIHNTKCTSLEGMPQSAISYLSNLGDWCAKNNCDVVVTGGTEDGHKTHCINNPVFDLSSTGAGAQTLGNKLLQDSQVTDICTAAVDKQYRKGNCLNFDEPTPHFHVQLSGAFACP